MDAKDFEKMIADYQSLKDGFNPFKVQMIDSEIEKRKIVEGSTSEELKKIKEESEKNIEKLIEESVDEYLEKYLTNGGKYNGL